MIKVLLYHLKSKDYWAFDTETGQATKSTPNSKAPSGTYQPWTSDVGPLWDLDFGQIWKLKGKWFALYFDGQSFIFQCQTDKWRVAPNSTAKVNGALFRRFCIYEEGEVTFSYRYISFLGFTGYFDVCHDLISEEEDDVFCYVRNMWDDWADKSTQDIKEYFDTLSKQYRKYLDNPARQHTELLDNE